MKKRIIFLGILVLLLMVWVFSAAIAEQDIFISDSGSIINFQVDLPSRPPEEGGFYSYGPQIYLQGFSYEVQAPRPEWSVVSSNGGPKLTLEGGNKASFRQDSNETYVAGTSYNYTVSCVWNGTTYTKDYQVNFIKSALPAGEIGISIAQLDVMTSPATIGSWTSCEKLEMVMISGKMYAVSANVGVTDSFSQYSIIESVYGSQCQKEPDNNPKYQNEDGTSIFGDSSSHIQVVGARQPGRYSGNVIVQYQGTNLACYIPNTLTITDESGNIPGPQLNYSKTDLTWYTGLPNSSQGQGGAYSSGEMGSFSIPGNIVDPDENDVTWNLTYIEGSGADLFELENRGAFSVYLVPKNENAITEGEYKYKLTGEYNGTTYEASLRIHAEPATSLPTQLDVRAFTTDDRGSALGRELPFTNGEITVYEGETFFINANMNGWFNFNYDCNNGEIRTIGDWGRAPDNERGISSDNTRKVIASTAGSYSARAWMRREGSNFALSCPFTIRVVDQETEPDVSLQIMGDYPWTNGSQSEINFPVYIGLPLMGTAEWENGNAWQWDDIIKVYVDNYDEMFQRYHGVPQWTVTPGDQNTGLLAYSWQAGLWNGPNGRVYGQLDTMPTQPMTEEFTVTCSWGGQTASKLIRVQVIQTGFTLPTCGNLDDVIETQIGQTLILAPTIEPSGWSLEGYTPELFVGGYGVGEFAELKQWNALSAEYEINKSGIFSDTVGLMVGSIMVTKNVTFLVKDENGKVPKDAPVLRPLNGTDVNYFIGANLEDQSTVAYKTPICRSMITGVAIDNYDQIQDQYTGDPEFTATASDTTVQFHVERMGSKNGGTLFLDEVPTSAKDVTFTMKVDWDGEYAEQQITVHFVTPPSLPSESTMVINDPLVVKTGEDITFRNLFKNVWSIEGYGATFVSVTATDGQKAGVEREYMYTGYRYFAKDPGVYTGSVTVRWNNILWSQMFTLNVTDASGNIPAVSLQISDNRSGAHEMNFYIGMRYQEGFFFNGEVQTEPQIDHFYLNNQADMEAAYPDDNAVWTLTRIFGTAELKKVTEGCYPDMDLQLKTLPSAPEDAQWKITCDWGDAHWETNYTIHFMTSPTGLPTGIEMDFVKGGKAILIAKTGDRLGINDKVSFKNEWSIPGESVGAIIGGGNNWQDGVTHDDHWIWDVANKPGVYDCNVGKTCGNVRWFEDFTLIVTKADGTLESSKYTPVGTVAKVPAGIQKIESEAFAGTKFTEVDIPAGVEIAADAFDDTGLIAVYAHDQNTIDWAVSNGFVAITD